MHISKVQEAMTALPAQFRDPACRFVPLHRGKKSSYLTKATVGTAASPMSRTTGVGWEDGLPYDSSLDESFRNRWDIGVRLEKCGPYGMGLLVIDADVVRRDDTVIGENSAIMRSYWEDGRVQLNNWCADNGVQLPPTLMLQTAGRDDSTHKPGWHLYYRQCPTWPVLRNCNLTPACEIKVKGITRLTPTMGVLRDLPIATMPEDLARRLEPVSALPSYGRHARTGARNVYVEQGYNSALFLLKSWILGQGYWWSEEQANEIVRFANSILSDPLDAQRLENTVLKHKDWKDGSAA